MGKIIGNIKFLDKEREDKLQNIIKRGVSAQSFLPFSLINTVSKISRDIYKQIGLIIDRKGNIQYIVIGNEREILWPTLYQFHLNRSNLRGVMAIHTHLHNHGIDNEDFTDLAYLRLDMIGVINVSDSGEPALVEFATIKIEDGKFKSKVIYSGSLTNLNIDYKSEVENLEYSINQNKINQNNFNSNEKVLLVNASKSSKYLLTEEIEELNELAKAADYKVVDTVIQRINRVDSSFLIGKGKLKELIIRSIEKGADKIIFYSDLTPVQAKNIASFVDIEVIDRTTLILNIFAKRAFSKDGKLKVELAKLKYLLPRVVDKAEALSRIRGGIGIKGPGEKIADVERRRIRDRIKGIENELKSFEKMREIRRRRRLRNSIPLVSIVGYTNSGKSTLLNTITNSELFVENLYFATLDAFSRRFRISPNIEIVLNDTVGFIKNLPKDILGAFKSTLEELNYSDLLIHLVDLSDENFQSYIEEVDKILTDIGASQIEQILVFNKIDKLDKDIYEELSNRHQGIFISAKDFKSTKPLIDYLNYFFTHKAKDGKDFGASSFY